MHYLERPGQSYVDLAHTLSARLDEETAALIGIRFIPGAHWYTRWHNAMRRLLTLVDPFYFPTRAERATDAAAPDVSRRRVMTGGQYEELLAWRDPARQAVLQERIQWFMNELVHNSVLLAGKHVQNWRGHSAIDATIVPVRGKAGKSKKPGNAAGPQRINTVEVDAGWYLRTGADSDHRGEDASGRKKPKVVYGYEAEIVTMVRNTPGQTSSDFPLLVIGVGMHVPGDIDCAVEPIYSGLRERGYPAGLIAADRAYNNLAPANFARPLRALGHDFVVDYRIDQLGIQAQFEDFLLVEGQWYLNCMPSRLVNAVLDSRKVLKGRKASKAESESLQELLTARESYRLKPKGLRDADGYQRFSLPDPAGYLPVDENTGELLEYPARKSVTIPPDVGEKFRQKFVFQSPEWTAWYGQRSIVEHQNAHLKDGRKEDLANTYKRGGRGFAFQFLATTLSVIAGNVRKLKTWMNAHDGMRDPQSPTITTRASRRPLEKKRPVRGRGIDGRKLAIPMRN
jgi:hypothetical protein